MPKVTQDFSPILNAQKEVALYEPFISLMKPYLKKGWVLVDTHKHPDPDSRTVWGDHKIEPDMALYETAREPEAPLCQASQMASVGEFKLDPIDEPFCVDPEKATKTKGRKQTKPFERKAETAKATRGQLTVYINAIQASQHRTRTFAFYVRRKWCRLLCHSRAGTEVTPLIDYTKSLDLHTFFWRFTHASAKHRGVDTTFEPVPSTDILPEVQDARSALGITSSAPLFKVLVPETPLDQALSTLPETSPPNRLFYVSEPFTTNHLFPVGRGPRCFYAYDPVTRTLRLLKDTWRVVGYRPEADTYQRLHEQRTPKILRVVAAGNVDGPLHRCGGDGLRELIHYRIVLDKLGKPLNQFSSTHELVTAVYDALIAHKHAFIQAGVLHQDISFGNIIIVGGCGYLIDWEFARWDGEGDGAAEERTGTWQFLSIRLLQNPATHHEIRDDIESFFYVLFWVAGRYAPNKLDPSERTEFLSMFDYKQLQPAAAKHRFVTAGQFSVTEGGPMLATEYFEDLLVSMIENLAPLYRKRSGKTAADQVGRMLTHDWMANEMAKALENKEWKAMRDAAVDHEVVHIIRNLKRRRRSSALYMQQAKRQKRVSGDGGDKDEDDGGDDDDEEGGDDDFVEY
ncbi:hypothetical protein BT96DRAFT_840765 [Gymnopus androsaceus JB14]|uniref:Protein kinase domain-containing protein n=1 Tax=Gymnopus androsaceus JB14 TaxID=1447944 RepID=A0A6A4GIJ6_9AGAR|nr:hypothetical protein BT96DRAFT_840765 [Gymnopus androsaceus JB14]